MSETEADKGPNTEEAAFETVETVPEETPAPPPDPAKPARSLAEWLARQGAPQAEVEGANDLPPAAPETNQPFEPPEPEPIPETMKGTASDPELDEVEPANIDQAEEGGDEEVEPFDKLAARARRFSSERVRTILESLLLVCDKPLPEEAIRQCTGIEIPMIREQLHKLQGSYRDGVRGIVLHEVAGGWQFRTDPGNSEFVRRFLKVKPQRLTRAALETLAIIAYRQPVTRPEIEDIRAVDCGAVIKALLDRKLIKIIGKREEVGRPLLYGTTTEFLEFFNLKDLGSLPTLREFQELNEENRELVDKEHGPAPVPTTENLVAELKDSTFEVKLSETNAEADAALAELETAMADSEEKAKEAAQMLNPQPPPGAPPAAAPQLSDDPEPPRSED